VFFATRLEINGAHLIRMRRENSTRAFTDGFWQWVQILQTGHYERAIEALYWQKKPPKPALFKKSIITFFGETTPLFPVIPNERLIGVINDAVEIEWRDDGGWAMAMIPLTSDVARAKEDDVHLMGLATSFFLRKFNGRYVLEHEIFHL
jgi:hypothetical protein